MTEKAENISPTRDPYSDTRFGLQNEKMLSTTTFEDTYLIPRPPKRVRFHHGFTPIHSSDTLGRVVEVPVEALLSQPQRTEKFKPLFKFDTTNETPLEFTFACSGTPHHYPHTDTSRAQIINSLPSDIVSDENVLLSVNNGTDTTMHKFHKGIGEPITDLTTKKLPCVGPFDRMTIGDVSSLGCGDDAVVCSPQMIGLADGVSGCNSQDHGNPSLWSRTLLNSILTSYSKHYNEDISNDTWNLELAEGYSNAKMLLDSLGETGSSTLLVARLNESKDALNVFNIGDSMLYVVRDGNIVWKTEPVKDVKSNCPQQLGTQTPLCNTPAGTFSSIPVQEGDLVLVCSDGLSDNLWDDDIQRILNSTYFNTDTPEQSGNLQLTVDSLVKEATSVSFDNFAVCPYHQNTKRVNTGGKNDDISVILARISLENGMVI